MDELLGALLRKQEGLQRRERRQALVKGDEMNTYEMLSGETIEYECATDAVREFVALVFANVANGAVSAAQLEALVYGPANPLLSTDILPGRAVVTKATYEHPAFHVMLDLIGRKRIANGQLDLEAARARHTMTVREAAGKLGITEGAVRQAIYGGRISAWREEGTYYLDPSVVSAYRVSRRGPKPVTHAPISHGLEVRCGSNDSARFNVKTQRPLASTRRVKGIVTGTAGSWKRVGVLAAKDDGARFFVLEPADEQNQLEFEGFYVRGWFRVMCTENNARKARESFTAFIAE